MQQQPPAVIKVYRSKKKVVGILFLSLLLIVPSIYFVVDGGDFLVIGLIGVVFFGACDIFWIISLFSNKPLLEITQWGFKISGIKQLIPWICVTDIKAYTVENVPGVEFHLNQDGIMRLQSEATSQKILQKINRKFINGDLALSLNTLKDADPEVVFAVIYGRWQAALHAARK